jgi:hypothetical protein
MPHTARADVRLDPTTPAKVWLHPDGIATYLTDYLEGYLSVGLSCDHFRSDNHTPEALVAWLRTTADAVEHAWAERRKAEQHEPLTDVACPVSCGRAVCILPEGHHGNHHDGRGFRWHDEEYMLRKAGMLT